VPRYSAGWHGWIAVSPSSVYGTILVEVVAYRLLLLDSHAFQREYAMKQAFNYLSPKDL
jgi:hypothetical protein